MAFLGGIFVPILAISLIFGNSFVGMAAVMLGLLTGLLYLMPPTQERLMALLSDIQARKGIATLIPILAVAGIFGTSFLMVLVLVAAGIALLAATLAYRLSGVTSWETSPVTTSIPAAPASVPALPAQASGEPVGEIDIRALCRGLPASVSGQVIATVEHLELVAAQARQSGDSRRAYDAQHGLHDYLPNAVNAWKAQPEHQQDVGELERALAQVREIAGPDDVDGEASRKAWEIQQRFLQERAGKNRN